MEKKNGTGKVEVDKEVLALIEVLPGYIKEVLLSHPKVNDLVEVVLDLGRTPEIRFSDSFIILDGREVTFDDLNYVIERIGEFGRDNRAGIPRTLHRISAIRNRNGRIIGLTCRVGRAIYGTAEIIMDIIQLGKSILLLGKPGIGKTTILREVARVLNDKMNKRVIIVDTSNEIAGDGDIPHPGIGRARRMQVVSPELQHKVMIEAVENHMPEVIIIDEMGTEEEAYAARTIAERGVQLIATAHGSTLENLIMNPTLSDLVGGVQAVILSDEEARRRGTQKTVLERRNPPTFDIVIEIRERNLLAIHFDVAITVDRMLRGIPPRPQLRRRNPDGSWEIIDWGDWAPGWEQRLKTSDPTTQAMDQSSEPYPKHGSNQARPSKIFLELLARKFNEDDTLRVYPFAISASKVTKAANSLKRKVKVVKLVSQADIILTLRSRYSEVERRLQKYSLRVPIYTIKSNTTTQIAKFFKEYFSINDDELSVAMREAEEAIRVVLEGEELYSELSPRPQHIRKSQHELAQKYNLISKSYGIEPERRVVIFRDEEVMSIYEAEMDNGGS